MAEPCPEAQSVLSIHGVGALTTMAFILTLEDPNRFERSRDVGPYLGLVPKEWQTGNRDPELRITRAGDPFVRRLLVNCAQRILGPLGQDSDLRRYAPALDGARWQVRQEQGGDCGRSQACGPDAPVVADGGSLRTLCPLTESGRGPLGLPSSVQRCPRAIEVDRFPPRPGDCELGSERCPRHELAREMAAPDEPDPLQHRRTKLCLDECEWKHGGNRSTGVARRLGSEGRTLLRTNSLDKERPPHGSRARSSTGLKSVNSPSPSLTCLLTRNGLPMRPFKKPLRSRPSSCSRRRK